MGFFKKLFTGIGFAAGFLFFGCLSVIVYASRGRHKPCHRRSSFWNTLERYLIFSWICDGVRSSRKRAEKSYYQRTGSDFWQTQTRVRPKSVKNAVPAVKTPRPETKSTSTGATRSVKPKRTERPSAAQKASAAQNSAPNASVPTMARHSISEADAEKHSEWSKPKPEPKQEHAAQQSEAKEVHQKSAQQLEAKRQQKLETLRTAMQKQICAIHADIELSANGQNDSGAVEQKLHVLLYKSTLPENDLNRALDELRTERRRQKAVQDYVATHIKSSIRELEGALTKLSAFSKLSHTPITVEFAEQTLKDLISTKNKKEITPELIIQTVADHFNVKYDDIISSKRNANIVHPRQIAMYLCRQMTTAPLQAVGKALGNRDHTTVIHGAEKIAKEVVQNESVRNTIDIIIKKINPS